MRMRYKKGITPVIALVMLMLITVGIVGLAYVWFSGLTSSQTEKGITIPPGGADCYKQGGNNYISVTIQNSGATASIGVTASAATSELIVFTINGVDCTANAVAQTLAPGAGGTIIAKAGFSANCGNAVAFPAGKYPVVVGTRTNVAQTQVICT